MQHIVGVCHQHDTWGNSTERKIIFSLYIYFIKTLPVHVSAFDSHRLEFLANQFLF